MRVQAQGSIWYDCFLDRKDSDKVRAYMKEHDCGAKKAVMDLHLQCEIYLYRDCTEVGYDTEEIEEVDTTAGDEEEDEED